MCGLVQVAGGRFRAPPPLAGADWPRYIRNCKKTGLITIVSLNVYNFPLQFIMEPYHEYFMEVLEKQMSPTLETALDKFFYNIVDAFEREHNRQRATTRLMNRLLH